MILIVAEHPGRFARPAYAVRPELLAAAGIDHQLDFLTDCFPRGRDQSFVELAADSSERPPAHLDGPKAAFELLLQLIAQDVRLVEQNRSIRLDPSRDNFRPAVARPADSEPCPANPRARCPSR